MTLSLGTALDADNLIGGMPRLIQAGMGIRVSSAALANVTARLGALGVVSAVALRHIVIEEVRAGNAEVIEIASRFPLPGYAQELLEWAPGGSKHKRPAPMDDPDPARGSLPKRLSTIAAYVEVMRAKLGHRGKIGINIMWKCTLTVLPSIYGAMLAGVDALLCGAGVPMELPDIVKRIRTGQNLSYEPLHGTGTNARLEIENDLPARLFEDRAAPHLMPILSNFAFPKRIFDIWDREHDGTRPFAFVLENHAAGGHNAPPRNRDTHGPQDDIDTYFDKVLALGVPIYVAGAFPTGGSREDYLHWRSRGAYGIQVGSRFALCTDSGLRPELKERVITRNRRMTGEVTTSKNLSPTGYPFKFVPVEGTLADPEIYEKRKRICNRGYLLQGHYEPQPDGTTKETYICPAMPLKQYEKLGGDVADTEGRICLCNALLSATGFYDDVEPPLLTLGKSGEQVTESLTARQVIEDIMTPEYVAVMAEKMVPPTEARPAVEEKGRYAVQERETCPV